MLWRCDIGRLLLSVISLLLVGCSEIKYNSSQQYYEMIIASDGCVVTNWGENIFTPVYLVKLTPDDVEWKKYSIYLFENFNYTRGFEYKIRVKEIENELCGIQDSDRITFYVTDILEKKVTNSKGIPESRVYLTEKIVASETGIPNNELLQYYIWKDTYQPSSWYYWTPIQTVEGFDYQCGFEYRILVEISANLDDNLKITSYSYKLKEIIDRTHTSSIGLDEVKYIIPY